MRHIGIMQGRLLPSEDQRIQCFPSRGWREEFSLAAAAGIESIEWIYEAYGKLVNPVTSSEGVTEIRALSSRWGVSVVSLCADILIDCPLFRGPKVDVRRSVGVVHWLLSRSREAGMERLVLPFVGANEVRTQQELEMAAGYIEEWAGEAEALGVEIHLETSLDPRRFVWLLDRLPSHVVKVTYDIGNSVQFGFDVREEMSAYGERVGSVHVKDSMRHGSTVPLGDGEADFKYCFQYFASIGYQGDYVLQAARLHDLDEVELAKRYRAFILSYLARSSTVDPQGLKGCTQPN